MFDLASSVVANAVLRPSSTSSAPSTNVSMEAVFIAEMTLMLSLDREIVAQVLQLKF